MTGLLYQLLRPINHSTRTLLINKLFVCNISNKEKQTQKKKSQITENHYIQYIQDSFKQNRCFALHRLDNCRGTLQSQLNRRVEKREVTTNSAGSQ